MRVAACSISAVPVVCKQRLNSEASSGSTVKQVAVARRSPAQHCHATCQHGLAQSASSAPPASRGCWIGVAGGVAVGRGQAPTANTSQVM